MKRRLKQSPGIAPWLTVSTTVIYVALSVVSAGILAVILFVYLNAGVAGIAHATPVDLIIFEGKAKEGKVQLEWTTVGETSNAYFVVERSCNQVDFEPFAEVKGAGHSKSRQHYFALDKGYCPDSTCYRLKQVDYAGQATYSRTVCVNTGLLKNEMRMYPNPAYNVVHISRSVATPAIIRFLDAQGKEALRQVVEQTMSVIDITGLTEGTYQVEVSGVSGIKVYSLTVIDNEP